MATRNSEALDAAGVGWILCSVIHVTEISMFKKSLTDKDKYFDTVTIYTHQLDATLFKKIV
jgi:hypothetical protein